MHVFECIRCGQTYDDRAGDHRCADLEQGDIESDKLDQIISLLQDIKENLEIIRHRI